MPSGRTHDRITFVCLVPVVVLGLLISRDFFLTLILAATFVFSGLMFGPDLDIHSVQYNRWGCFKPLWLPYRKMLRHRSIFSHGPVIGTVLRLIYLLTIVIVLAMVGVAIAQIIWGFPWNWQTFIHNVVNLIATKYNSQAITAGIGLELGAMSHALSDSLVSAYKRSRKKRPVAKKLKKNFTFKSSDKKK